MRYGIFRLGWVGLAGTLALSGCMMPPNDSVTTPPAAPAAAAQAPAGGGPDTAAAPDLAQSIFFAPDTAELTPEARRALGGWADTLRRRPGQTVTIVGHGDEHSTRDYSIALGERRAEAVKAYLMARGIPEQQLATTSFGKERPATPGASEAARALDRRAVLVFESVAAVPPME